jgi:hypothetical protein
MVVAIPANPQLARLNDLYFRGLDNNFPDFYREVEWRREFDADQKAGTPPNLTLLRLMHDHFGDIKTAIAGVNTPGTQWRIITTPSAPSSTRSRTANSATTR